MRQHPMVISFWTTTLCLPMWKCTFWGPAIAGCCASSEWRGCYVRILQRNIQKDCSIVEWYVEKSEYWGDCIVENLFKTILNIAWTQNTKIVTGGICCDHFVRQNFRRGNVPTGRGSAPLVSNLWNHDRIEIIFNQRPDRWAMESNDKRSRRGGNQWITQWVL